MNVQLQTLEKNSALKVHYIVIQAYSAQISGN